MNQAPPAFELDQVTVRYPSVAALENVSLRIQAGEQVALVGPSGAGKTTLLRLLNGTLRPTSGKVSVNGRELRTISPRELRLLRSQIGMVHQDLSLIPNVRVLQNVMAGRLGRVSLLGSLRMMLLPNRKELIEIHGLLERVGIEDKLYQRTDRLSGGQQQRVAIARALYQQCDALLADEPVSSVDPARASDTVQLLRRISQEDGLTLCMSLHNLKLARAYFPRLVGIRHGRVVFDERASELADDAFHELYELAPGERSDDLMEH